MTSRLARMHEFNFATLQDSLAARDSSDSLARVEAPIAPKDTLGLGGWLAAVALTLGAVGLSAGAALEYFDPPELAPGPTATALEPHPWQADPELARARAIQAERVLRADQAPAIQIASLPIEQPVAPPATASDTDNPY